MSWTPVPYGTFSPQAKIAQSTTRTRLGTGASVGTSTATSLGCRELWISADPANTGTVYVGDNTVTSTGGGNVHTALAAGGGIVMQVSNANLVYVVGSASGQVVYWSVLDA